MTGAGGIERGDVAARRAVGKAARVATPRGSHQGWTAPPDRADPVALLVAQNRTREQDLVPVRHGRMLTGPFPFFRGSAKIMAADLRGTPRAGFTVQLCGDAHLSNFGAFASPERTLLFDLNDFDETLPGPFEYDVKRLSASCAVAARSNGFTAAEQRDVTMASVRAYRDAMSEFAEMRTMDVWYARRSVEDIAAALELHGGAQKDKARRKTVEAAAKAARKGSQKAMTRDSLQALDKLAERVDGTYRIVSRPPIVIPARDLVGHFGLASPEELDGAVRRLLDSYRETLQGDRLHLLERFQIVDVARKVVGVGSVGTRAFIALLRGRDDADPLFLQLKEATASVLEDHLPKSRYRHPGRRVVEGQRLMQASSDIYLGWATGVEAGRYFYWRQLRDMKAAAVVETMDPVVLGLYAGECGWTLARAHARSGDPIAIAAYLGKGDDFDRSVTDFSMRYADRNEEDFAAFQDAARTGRIEVVEGL
jgi:uncharacterized protein (DUF2252 family)